MDGGSLSGTLFLIFLVLKLTHNITWSWWWVTSPLWIDALGTIAVIAILAAFGINVFAGFKRILRLWRDLARTYPLRCRARISLYFWNPFHPTRKARYAHQKKKAIR
jgi:hypothetical protein